MNSILGGEVFSHEIDGWVVSWESAGKYRHWCLLEKPGHTERVVIVLKNPGSLSGDGSNLRRDTTPRILRLVGDAVRINWLVVNLFDYATPRPTELHEQWQHRDSDAVVFDRIDLGPSRFLVFAHGDFGADQAADYAARVAMVRGQWAHLQKIAIAATKADNPVHPMNWQRSNLLPDVVAAISSALKEVQHGLAANCGP